MKIENVQAFVGQHCETTATGTLLRQLGIELSEPMLFGLGEGLNFMFWKMKSMAFPFIGGRIKPGILTQNIARNLQLELIEKETSSPQKAWSHVKQLLDDGHVVGLKLDCFHLEYFKNAPHFAAHYVAIYGYDTENAFLIDTEPQGVQVKTSLDSLARARAEKGFMASKHLYYTLRPSGKHFELEKAIPAAIRNNAREYLNPPITNIGHKGISKASAEIQKWFKTSHNIEHEFKTAAMLMERAGTGGALFRNFYRDFLLESHRLLSLKPLKTGHEAFVEIASLWQQVAELFEKAGESQDFQYIAQASQTLKALSDKEKSAMEILARL